jgi:hypothetical protein
VTDPRNNGFGGLGAAYLAWTDASGTSQTFVFDVVTDEDWDDGADVTEHPVERGANVSDNVRVRVSRCTLKVFATNEPIDDNQFDQMVPVEVDINMPTLPTIPNVMGIINVPKWVDLLDLRSAIGSLGGLLGSAIGGAAGNTGVGGAVGAIAASALAGVFLNGYEILVPTATTGGPSPPPPATVITAQTLAPSAPDDYVQRAINFLLNLKDGAQLLTVFGTKQFADNMVIDGITTHADSETGTGREIALSFREIRIVTTTTVAAPKPAFSRAQTPASLGNQNTDDDGTDLQSAAYTAVHGYPPPVN